MSEGVLVKRGIVTLAAVATLCAGILTLGSLSDSPAVGAPADPVITTEADPIAPTLTLLDSLPVKGRAPKTGYDRGLFGQAWSDDVTVPGGHNGCDTRNDILRRDLTAVELKPGTNGCVVLSGVLEDPYTGRQIAFERGRTTSREVQIDHVVALSDAWQKGAQQWDETTRRNFANDPANLQATFGPINEQKGDGDAATWLPPNTSYRCAYVSRIVQVKAAYGLWVTAAERDAIARVLGGDCPPAEPPAEIPEPVPAPLVAPPPEPGLPVFFPNCAAARAAGAAPLLLGQPGYRPELDRDGDGVACE